MIGVGINLMKMGVLGGDAGIGLGVGLLGQATSYLNGIAPYHWFDFINDRCLYASNDVGGVSGATGYSFARASAGYYTNADGTLTSFASGALRRGNRGVLIEGARTNLCLQSQTLDNATWTKARATVTANAATAPDGTSTADALIEDATAANTHSALQNITIANTTAYTLSVFVKANTRSWIQLALFDGTANFSAYFNVGAGAVGTVAAATTAAITALANGWYLCRITFTSTNTAGVARIFLATADNTQSYNGDNASGIYLWGAQLEAASFVSSYIPTTTASATRAADVLTCTAGVSYPLTLWAEFERAVDTGTIEGVFAADSGADTNQALLYVSAADALRAFLTNGGVTQADVAVAGAISISTATKAAARFGTSSVQAAKGGTLGTENTTATAPASPTTLRFGSRVATPLWGYIPRAAVMNTDLSSANLQAVTT